MAPTRSHVPVGGRDSTTACGWLGDTAGTWQSGQRAWRCYLPLQEHFPGAHWALRSPVLHLLISSCGSSVGKEWQWGPVSPGVFWGDAAWPRKAPGDGRSGSAGQQRKMPWGVSISSQHSRCKTSAGPALRGKKIRDVMDAITVQVRGGDPRRAGRSHSPGRRCAGQRGRRWVRAGLLGSLGRKGRALWPRPWRGVSTVGTEVRTCPCWAGVSQGAALCVCH